MEYVVVVNDALMLSSVHICTKELSSAKYTLYFVYENTPAELDNVLNLVVFHLLMIKIAISHWLSFGEFIHVKNYCVI